MVFMGSEFPRSEFSSFLPDIKHPDYTESQNHGYKILPISSTSRNWVFDSSLRSGGVSVFLLFFSGERTSSAILHKLYSTGHSAVQFWRE